MIFCDAGLYYSNRLRDNARNSAGPPATIRCESRQARKGATVATDSCAGVWLAGPYIFDKILLFDKVLQELEKAASGNTERLFRSTNVSV